MKIICYVLFISLIISLNYSISQVKALPLKNEVYILLKNDSNISINDTINIIRIRYALNDRSQFYIVLNSNITQYVEEFTEGKPGLTISKKEIYEQDMFFLDHFINSKYKDVPPQVLTNICCGCPNLFYYQIVKKRFRMKTIKSLRLTGDGFTYRP